MAVQYTVQISDADYRALCFVTENPNAYVDEMLQNILDK